MKWLRRSAWAIFALATIVVSAVAGWSDDTCANLNATMHLEDLGYAHRLLVIRNQETDSRKQYQNCTEAARKIPTLKERRREVERCQTKYDNERIEHQKERNDAAANHEKSIDKIQFDKQWKCGSHGKSPPAGPSTRTPAD